MHKIFGFILLILASNLLHAQALTDAEIKNWSKAYAGVMKWSQTNDLKNDLMKESAKVEDGRMFSSMVQYIRAGGKHYKSLVKVLKDNGYSDPDHWADTSDRIMIAYMANMIVGKEKELDTQMKQMEGMMHNDQVSAEQKALIENMLARVKSSLKAAEKATAEDKAGVARNLSFLEDVFKTQAEQANAAK